MTPFPSRGNRVEKLQHWNRRAWQEIALLKVRVEMLETVMKVETGGDYEYTPEGDPWEVEHIYDNRMVLFAFVFGVLMGSGITAFFLI